MGVGGLLLLHLLCTVAEEPRGLMADLEGLLRFYDQNSENIVIPLLGRVKGEHHVRQHLLLSQGTTGSGIQIKLVVRKGVIGSQNLEQSHWTCVR
jgi:hypothetical protein